MNYDRLKGASWFYGVKNIAVIIGGSGGIGSWLTLMLTRAGVADLIIYDDDAIEPHNLGGQLFTIRGEGRSKVEEITDVVHSFTGRDITPFNEKFTPESMAAPYMFSAFDNMQARKDMFEKWMANYGGSTNSLFVDGRLTMEHFQVFAVRGKDTDAQLAYQSEHLFDDKDVEEEDCTAKQTSHSAAMVASMMVSVFTNYVSACNTGKTDYYSVPLLLDFHMPTHMADVIYPSKLGMSCV